MTDKKRNYTAEQNHLVAQISSTYGTDPDDIIFFNNDPNPFFGFETSCVMINRLDKPKAVDIEPIDPISPDSVSHRCQIYFHDGSSFSAVGVANRNEEIDGEKASDQQLAWLASSRALRSTLRISGRNLLKLHHAAKVGKKPEPEYTGESSNRSSENAQAHVIGQEIGLIDGDDKRLWYRLLEKRYKVTSTSQLTDAELADWVAYLITLTVQPAMSAAA